MRPGQFLDALLLQGNLIFLNVVFLPIYNRLLGTTGKIINFNAFLFTAYVNRSTIELKKVISNYPQLVGQLPSF